MRRTSFHEARLAAHAGGSSQWLQQQVTAMGGYLGGRLGPTTGRPAALAVIYRGLNDCFTQVLEMARKLGMGKLGKVAIDSTRIKASACRDKLDTEQQLRDLRAGLRRQVRRWQQMVDRDDADSGGLEVAIEVQVLPSFLYPGRAVLPSRT